MGYTQEKIIRVHEPEPECCCGCGYEGTATALALKELCCWPLSIFYCCMACKEPNPDLAHVASIINMVFMWINYVFCGLSCVASIYFFNHPAETYDFYITIIFFNFFVKGDGWNLGKIFLLYAVGFALGGYFYQYLSGKFLEFEVYLRTEEAKKKAEQQCEL